MDEEMTPMLEEELFNEAMEKLWKIGIKVREVEVRQWYNWAYTHRDDDGVLHYHYESDFGKTDFKWRDDSGKLGPTKIVESIWEGYPPKVKKKR